MAEIARHTWSKLVIHVTLVGFVLLLAFAATAQAQTRLHVHPHLGTLALDFEPLPALGVTIDEEVLWGVGLGYSLSDRIAIEGQYASAGFGVRAAGVEVVSGRFHILSAGVRLALLSVPHVDVTASLHPGVLIATNDVADANRNLAVPAAVDVVVLPERRVRLRAGVRDFLHLCDPPEGLDGILCDDGDWLHHIATSVGVELQL